MLILPFSWLSFANSCNRHSTPSIRPHNAVRLRLIKTVRRRWCTSYHACSKHFEWLTSSHRRHHIESKSQQHANHRHKELYRQLPNEQFRGHGRVHRARSNQRLRPHERSRLVDPGHLDVRDVIRHNTIQRQEPQRHFRQHPAG